MTIAVVRTQGRESGGELRLALRAWLVKYDRELPHQSLGRLTPAELCAMSLGKPHVAAA